MDGWRCNTGRRASKKSLGGDCRWVVSTGMLMLRRKPCLFVGWTGQEADAASGHALTHVGREDCGRHTPERRWRTRPGTRGPWGCPGAAREASSSAGCWCSPAVVQPSSLSPPQACQLQGDRRQRAHLLSAIHHHRAVQNSITRWRSGFFPLA